MRLLPRLEGLLDRLATAFTLVAALCAVAMTALVVLSATMRYLFQAPFHFTEELVALLLLASVFLIFPYATSRGEHIRVKALLQALPPRCHGVLEGFALLVMAVFATLFTVHAHEFLSFSLKIGARSEQTRILLWPWLLILPVSTGLVGLIALLKLLRALCGRFAAAR